MQHVQVGLRGTDEGGKLTLVLALHVLEGKDGGGLLVDDGAETSLALDNDIGDTHLAAQGGEEDDELDGVNVVGDDDEGRLLRLNQGDGVVETVLDEEGLLGVLHQQRINGTKQSHSMDETYLRLSLLLLSGCLCNGVKASLLLLLGLGAVLVQELEQLRSGVLVERVRELGNGRGDLETLAEDDLLALKADVFWPLHEACEVLLGLDVLAFDRSHPT